MITKNLTIAWRNIWKNGIYSIINIAGLALGLAVVILILFWVVDELNYDKYNKNLDQIYTVYEHQQYSGGKELFTNCTPFPLGKELAEKFPEIKEATTYADLGSYPVKYQDHEYKVGPIVCTDNNFLDIFTYKLLEGDKNSLKSGTQVIITDELAKLFFGNEPALGKTLLIDNDQSFSVGAVIAKPEGNSSFKFKILAPMKVIEAHGNNLNEWGNNWPNTTLLLAKDADTKALDTKIVNICKDKGQENTSLHLFAYKKSHLYSYSGKNNRIQYIYQFLGIALIIILIASINFINLSISRAEQRRSEVGVRKVLGANKINITKQFLLEKGLMILASIAISILLIFAFLSPFRSVSGKTINLSMVQNVYLIMLMLAVLLIVLISSVIYPSVYLSSVNAVNALKKSVSSKNKAFNFRNILITIQFCLSIVLICGSIVIAKQIKFVDQFDLGYNHSNLIYLSLDGTSKSKSEALKDEFSKITGVESMTCSDKLPFWGGNSSWGFDWEGKDPENEVLICRMHIDNNYFKTMGIKLVEGSGFPDNYNRVVPKEEYKRPQVILNKEAIKRMNMDNPIGKYFSTKNGDKGSIVGVTEDFHFESLRSEVEPMLLVPLLDNPNYMIVRISPNNYTKTIADIKDTWKKVEPSTKCDLGFFDDRLDNMYKSELRIADLIKYFTFVAIFISCIGLFGLSLFIIERRRKEIGIRKVNGARISEVLLMLNKNFIQWVIFSFVIAIPIAYFIMHRWLENFAYKTTLKWWIFALSGVIALVIALFTVSWQSWRAATRNPVEALKYE